MLGILSASLWVPMQTKAQRVAVKTNALYWAASTPNFGAEFRVNRHVTFNFEAAYNRIKIFNIVTRGTMITPEVRYWFSARPQARHYLGIMGLATNYNICLDHERHIGDAFGAGLTYGYSFPLSRHWSLEASIGAGYGYRREKKYDTQTETKPERPNYNKWQFLPMKAGLSFIYIIK